jgi:hypothetical protein
MCSFMHDMDIEVYIFLLNQGGYPRDGYFNLNRKQKTDIFLAFSAVFFRI